MVDTEKLHRMIQQFKSDAKPMDLNLQRTCTVKDLNRAIDCMGKLLDEFLKEIENYR